MGDPENPKTMSVLLPPGCGFFPSEDQLVRYYLPSKNNDSHNLNGYDLIEELDLYDYEPFDLPDNVCYAYGCGGRRRHWYCYTKVRVLKENRGGRRKAKGGYWRRSGKIRDVVGSGGNSVVGSRAKFVYYLRNSAKSVIRTDWVLYEYSLLDHVKASFVLCRVFVKSRGGNSISENVLNSCAEESVSAVRHVGVQHDGFLTPEIVEANVQHENSVDRENDLSRYPLRMSSELDDSVLIRTFPEVSCQFPSSIQPNDLVMTSGLISDNMFLDAESNKQLLSILEDDFIELDDLMD